MVVLASSQTRSLIESFTVEPASGHLEEATPAQRTKVLSLTGTNFISKRLTSVCSVQNDFLEAMYLLKKEEIVCRFGYVREVLLLHVTRASAVNSIIRDNFNWRRVRRSKFGLGTSFSHDLMYCHRYSNYNIGHDRAIIVTKVLVANCKPPCENEVVPPPMFDTTLGNYDKVYVKYNDNEYLPVFVAFYNVSNVNPADIIDSGERKIHESVLEGVNKYLQRFPRNARHFQNQHLPKRLNSSNVPRPISQPQQKTQNARRWKHNNVIARQDSLGDLTSIKKTTLTRSLANSDFENDNLYKFSRSQSIRSIQPSSSLNTIQHRGLQNAMVKPASPPSTLNAIQNRGLQNATIKPTPLPRTLNTIQSRGSQIAMVKLTPPSSSSKAIQNRGLQNSMIKPTLVPGTLNRPQYLDFDEIITQNMSSSNFHQNTNSYDYHRDNTSEDYHYSFQNARVVRYPSNRKPSQEKSKCCRCIIM